MADVTGELGGQPILLENAATEATLYALLQATLANSKSKSNADKIQKAYEEALKATTKKQKENKEKLEQEIKKRADLNKQIQEEKERREKMLKGMAEAAVALKNLGQSIGNLVGGLMDAAFSSATPKVTDFTNALSGIPIIGPVIASVGKAMQDTVDKFRDLSTVGADFGRGIHTMRSMATQAGLSLETYSKAIVDNGKDLAALGGSTAAGAKIFTQVNASMKGPFANGLARLGFSMEEQAELTAGYLAQQTRMGRAQRMTQEQLNEGAREYLLELDKLARVHGMTRKEAQALLDQQMADKRLKLFYAQLGSSGKETQSFMVGLQKGNKEFADGMADLMMNNGIPSANNAMAQSIALNQPRLVELAKQLRAGTISQEQANKIIREEAAIAEEKARREGKNMSLLANQGAIVYDSTAALIGMGKHGEKAAEATEAQRQAQEDATKNMALLDRQLLDLRNTLLNALMPVFVKVSDAIQKSIPAIIRFTNDLLKVMEKDGVSGAIRFALQSLGEILGPMLMDVLKGIFSSPIVIGGLIMGITALFAAAAVKTALVKAIEDALDGGGKGKGKSGPARDPKTGRFTKAPSPSTMGRMGNFLKGGGIGLGGAVLEYAGEKASEAGHTKTGAALDIAGSTAKYAGMGAMVGSIIPGVGTVVGGGLGALFGLGAGLFSSGDKLFGSNDKGKPTTPATATPTNNTTTPAAAPTTPDKSGPQSKDIQVAAQVAKTTTPKEVKELATALKELDYSKLIIPDTAHSSMEAGALKMRQLRGEVNALSTAFKDLDNTGLNKITEGLGRLDASFKSFNKSFVDNFMTKFKELDKKTQEALLTDLNTKMDLLNTSVQSLVELEQGNSRHHANTAKNTRTSSGRVN